MEKAREIRVKADEEFAIEKVQYSRNDRVFLEFLIYGNQAKLVKQEQQAIDAQFEKKRKASEVSQKMYVRIYVSHHFFKLMVYLSA